MGAFGARPGLAAAELPAARDALGSWHRAVILGGQGHYAAARVQLAAVRRRTADPVLLSLAASTEGSLLRQLGWHAVASGPDGRAAALALPGGALALAPEGAAPDRIDAICDALTGLAADALGTGRLALARRLLDRSRAALDPDGLRWRAWIRWHWVSAETALASGAAGEALPHTREALALAEAAPSVRHRVKSRLLVAAATAASGDIEQARALADTVAAECRAHDLLPLRWACAMLRAGLSDPAAAGEAEECAAGIARRGGRFRPHGTA
ncbi:hypothetical protein [Nocardia lijiangensis]|uniref:hypothetical protein n=1 Tax=Nocardia lijiangensis TaxID=299618 RepID=UPI0008344D86|nr:hypothetical protein [Nocardia lijiangensis]